MAITPDEDKTAFWNRIRGDPYVQFNMGLTGKDDAYAAQYIMKRRQNDHDELNDKSRYIFIYDQPSGEAKGSFVQSVMQIDGLMPAARQWLIDDTMQQIVALCGEGNEDGWTVNGRRIYKTVVVGDLTAAAGFYRTGVRIYYFSATPTRKKTL